MWCYYSILFGLLCVFFFYSFMEGYVCHQHYLMLNITTYVTLSRLPKVKHFLNMLLTHVIQWTKTYNWSRRNRYWKLYNTIFDPMYTIYKYVPGPFSPSFSHCLWVSWGVLSTAHICAYMVVDVCWSCAVLCYCTLLGGKTINTDQK